jgi:lysophospholipase L1-like esterase
VVLVAALAAPALAAPRAKVLVVGDSLEELTGPHLSELLPGVEVTVDAVGGSNTFEILDLFEESYEPAYSVVVFDGGTNDNPNYPSILEENLAKVEATVGDRCMVVPTIHGYTVEGTDNHGKNAVVHKFAAARPGTETPDWASMVNHDPGLLEPDNLHPNSEGSERRAELIAQGILGCLAHEESAGVAAAPEEASASSAEVEAVRLDPVGKLAKREKSILERTAIGLFRDAAMVALLGGLLPGG